MIITVLLLLHLSKNFVYSLHQHKPWQGKLKQINKLNQYQKIKIVDYHNRLRSLVANGQAKSYSDFKGRDIQSLQWDDELEKSSISYVQFCNYQHSSTVGYKFDEDFPFGVGENISLINLCHKCDTDLALEKAMEGWADERFHYDHRTGYCGVRHCGHYTAMVAAPSTRVGCAVAECYHTENNPRRDYDVPRLLTVCQYYPSGNRRVNKVDLPPYTYLRDYRSEEIGDLCHTGSYTTSSYQESYQGVCKKHVSICSEKKLRNSKKISGRARCLHFGKCIEHSETKYSCQCQDFRIPKTNHIATFSGQWCEKVNCKLFHRKSVGLPRSSFKKYQISLDGKHVKTFYDESMDYFSSYSKGLSWCLMYEDCAGLVRVNYSRYRYLYVWLAVSKIPEDELVYGDDRNAISYYDCSL